MLLWGKPWETTAKAEGAPSETVVTEFPAFNILLVCLLPLFVQLQQKEKLRYQCFICPVFSYEGNL